MFKQKKLLDAMATLCIHDMENATPEEQELMMPILRKMLADLEEILNDDERSEKKELKNEE